MKRPTASSSGSTGCCQVKGNRGIREIHRELGRIMWDDVGMARTEASLARALEAIPKLRDEFWQTVSVPGTSGQSQSEPRVRRPRRRLPRVRGAARPRRARAARVVRRPFSRREPDCRRRGAARRRQFFIRGGLGVQRRRPEAGAAQGTSRVRGGASDAEKLQIRHWLRFVP